MAALGTAAVRLTDLRSYRFSVDTFGVDIVHLEPTSFDVGIRGTVIHGNGLEMDALVGTRMRETNAAISSSSRIVLGDGYVWGTDNVSGVLEPTRDRSTVAGFSLFTPDGLAGRLIVPFAAAYRRVGTGTHEGVKVVHLRATPRGAAGYASALQFKGDVTADVWIASDGGYLSAMKIAGTGSHRDPSTGATIEDQLLVAFEVTHPDDAANVVERPVPPLPDPVRPSGAPVDLQLDYRVMPSNGKAPTSSDADAIAVTLRYRLGVPDRPVKVTVIGRDRIRVTVCNTSRPDQDRKLVLAKGELTVVPLPASAYGSTGTPGATALPAVGSEIDPGLTPIAPATGLGITGSHVDPTTGRRGLAFMLGNEATATFRTYAEAHPGEYVAVALDGTVLATLPIDGPVTQGHFVFTGDYTEAESRLLAQSLYRDPLPFPLRLTGDVEVPASGS